MAGVAQTQGAYLYNRLATGYDRRWHRYLEATLNPAVEAIDISRPIRLLDVACGTGELARRILARAPGATVTGIDCSEEMLRVARRKLEGENRVRLQQAFAKSLPFHDGVFDWVVCCNSLHYFRNSEKVLSEMVRVLRPGGKLLILDWCRDSWHCRLVNRWLSLFDGTHVRMYTTEELRNLATQHSIAVESVRRFRISWSFGLKIWEMMLLVGSMPHRREEKA